MKAGIGSSQYKSAEGKPEEAFPNLMKYSAPPPDAADDPP